MALIKLMGCSLVITATPPRTRTSQLARNPHPPLCAWSWYECACLVSFFRNVFHGFWSAFHHSAAAAATVQSIHGADMRERSTEIAFVRGGCVTFCLGFMDSCAL
uniref:Putative secreted protein n=1 Tax=Anopheles marajoara TaxID=58244 RepID=A0A2M4C8L5_9DIPT